MRILALLFILLIKNLAKYIEWKLKKFSNNLIFIHRFNFHSFRSSSFSTFLLLCKNI